MEKNPALQIEANMDCSGRLTTSRISEQIWDELEFNCIGNFFISFSLITNIRP